MNTNESDEKQRTVKPPKAEAPAATVKPEDGQAVAVGTVPPWGPWMAVFYAVLVFILAQLIAGILITVYPVARGWNNTMANDWLNNSVIAQFWLVLFAEALTFGGIWWFVRRRGARLGSIGWRRPRALDPLYTLAGFGVYWLGYTVLLTLAVDVFPSLNVNQKQQLGFQNATGTLSLVLTFVSLVILPPLVEETVFRGFIFTSLRGKMKWWWAALLTSLIFASAHLEFGSGKPLLWVAALDTFTLSMVLCFLRQKTDSLWPGILLHALKNGVAFVTLFILHLS